MLLLLDHMLSRFSGCEQASCYKRQCLPRFWFRRWNNQDLGLSTLESERMSLLSLLIACLQLTAHATSQLTYTQGGRITGLTVCDSSHSVASAPQFAPKSNASLPHSLTLQPLRIRMLWRLANFTLGASNSFRVRRRGHHGGPRLWGL